MTRIAAIAMANPSLLLQNASAQLGRMRERTLRGHPKWLASSVKKQLD